MSKGLTEKRKAAIKELKRMPFRHLARFKRVLDLYTSTERFDALAVWCQDNITPSAKLNRITDALWEG
jgi:hypothetical protein